VLTQCAIWLTSRPEGIESLIYHSTMREVSKAAAQQKARDIAALPIAVVGVSDNLALARQAAIYEATHEMGYTDCFAAALAKMNNAALLTGDPVFEQVGKKVRIGRLK